MKPIKIKNREMIEAITLGEAYIEVNNRKFMLYEVQHIIGSDIYEVQDEEEKKLLNKALHEENPLLSEHDIDAMIGIEKGK
jgi:hypothetical protein